MNKSIDRNERLHIEDILRQSRSLGHRWLHEPAAIWVAIAVAVLLLVLLLGSFGGTDANVRYVTQPVERGNLVVSVTATGSVQPTNQVDVSSELSGSVRKVLVDYNSPVKAGQPLAELDTDKLNATVQSSRAKLAAARAKVNEAQATVVEKRRDVDRKRALAGKLVGSQQNLDVAQAAFDRAEAALASAQAEVGAAEADLKLNETNLAKACICSPIDGVVLTRNVEPGQTVASSFQAPVLFSIAEDLRQMELQVDVDEADVGQVKAGQFATFTVDAFPDRRFPAQIRYVRYAPETIQGVVTYKAVLTIDNTELLLRPGMTATADIRVMQVDNALLIPNAALRYSPPASKETSDRRSFVQRILPGPPAFRQATKREDQGDERTVWAMKNGALVSIQVTIGASDGRLTEVKSGDIEPGQAVVVDQTAAKS